MSSPTHPAACIGLGLCAAEVPDGAPSQVAPIGDGGFS